MVRKRDERGATALLFALLSIVLFAAGALVVDLSSTVTERQRLHDTLDTAAHAGAYELPGDGARAVSSAITMAHGNDSAVTPGTSLLCVVGSTGGTRQVKANQIPGTCNPGPPPYTASAYPGLRCNTRICAIPCYASQGDTCNTIKLTARKSVPFSFAKALGIDHGDTGELYAAACKGACGAELPNPMDVVVVADRTYSMPSADRTAMVAGIKAMLQTMDPTQQFVSLATIHKSKGTGTCRTSSTSPGGSTIAALRSSASSGTWVPVSFTDNYLNTPAPPAVPSLNSSNPLVTNLTCLTGDPSGGHRTHLAAAMKGASRYLLGLDPNNLSSLPARTGGTPKKVLIFETDGQPDELLNNGVPNLGASGDLGADLNYYGNGNGIRGCENFLNIANQAKARGALIVTIGYGSAKDAPCEKATDSSGYSRTPRAPWVRDYLAAAASPNPQTGEPSRADFGCLTPAARAAENADGDFFYCAATAAELGPIFSSAMGSISSSIRLVNLP